MRILFPTDFSSGAEHAIIFALKLAKRLNAQITVLHIYRVPELSPWVDLSNVSREFNEAATLDEFDHFKSQIDILKKIAKENGIQDVDINYSLRESDNIVPAILTESKEVLADMIILGTTGASGFKEMFFGSVATKVMEESVCPVLLVPDSAIYKGIRQLGLTLDYMSEDLGLVQAALGMAKKIGGHLDCFHVDIIDEHKRNQGINELPEELKNESHISFHTHYSLDLEKGILEYCEQNQLDLLVMRVHHRNRLRELISYSLARKVAYHIQIPLLTFHVDSKN